ncbi:thioredoxin [Deminuibacter soli]|uniref:Thioredoxin n=1 Tax=Deminuibacter soli TaxID=2291815 RepID=A0A3E1NH03_9BACT|nr:thioredoxin [Deminuibacter soli]RFM27236.1 thioredoxin [Deminuibacter soli]
MDTTDKKETFRDIIQSGKPVLVDFFAEWCGPCKTMAPVLKQVQEKMKDELRILKMDVDKNPAVAQAFGIQGVPTFILFKNGEIVWRQSGAMPQAQLESFLRQNM